MIGIENPNTKAVKAVYCHWDGYIEHNGAILTEHYAASPKVNNLIALGDISSLRPEIGEKHAFSKLEVPMDGDAYDKLYGDMTTFYGRDREETGTQYKRFDTAKEAVTHYEHCGAEYYYLFRYDADQQAGKWFYKKGSAGAWKRLATALKAKAKEEEFA